MVRTVVETVGWATAVVGVVTGGVDVLVLVVVDVEAAGVLGVTGNFGTVSPGRPSESSPTSITRRLAEARARLARSAAPEATSYAVRFRFTAAWATAVSARASASKAAPS